MRRGETHNSDRRTHTHIERDRERERGRMKKKKKKKKKKNSCNIHSAGNHDENSWNM
tara:strand:+ start:297 stop:467 length:171 start_codon:yes stop_codon:yes gene_type:complete